MRGLFFTGTDTGVGKTWVMVAVARSLRARGVQVGVCKPVATGARWTGGRWVNEDTVRLAQAAGVADCLERVTPWVFAEPVAPPVAAACQGMTLSLTALVAAVEWWRERTELVLVEGVGGLLCPLTERETVADLAACLKLPLIVVARTTLGTLNHTLLTLEVAARRRLTVAGVILNEGEPPRGSLAEQTNATELQRRIDVPLLTVVKHRVAPEEERLEEIAYIDWWQLSRGGMSATGTGSPGLGGTV